MRRSSSPGRYPNGSVAVLVALLCASACSSDDVTDTMSYRVRGYQIDMGTNYWGQLYDDGHGIARAAAGACLLHASFDTWIAYEVRAVDPNLLHFIDGIQCVSYVDTSGTPALSGIIALQYHPPGGYDVRFKNLRIEAL